MKSILGVERIEAGSVRVDGREVAGWPPHRIARLAKRREWLFNLFPILKERRSRQQRPCPAVSSKC
jgi:ABC-type branched-subunit amino acid transport system ATPase component